MNPTSACLPIYLFYYIQFCSLLCCLSLSYVIVFYLIMCYFILSFYSLLSYLTLSYLVQFLSPPTTSYMLISCFSFSPFIPHLHFCLSLPALHLSPSLFPYVYPTSSPPPPFNFLSGHPIVGDVKYGAPQSFRLRDIALHSLSLTIPHPITKIEVQTTSINKTSSVCYSCHFPQYCLVTAPCAQA